MPDQSVVAGKKSSPLFGWRGAVTDSELSANAKHVALALSLHMSERGDSCFPSVETLAAETSRGKKTVIDAIRALETAGFLTVRRDKSPGRGSSNRYTAIFSKRVLDQLEKGSEMTPEGVKESVKKPSSATSAEKGSGSRKPDPVWDALVEVCGAPATRSETSDFAKTVNEIRKVLASHVLDQPYEALFKGMVAAADARRREFIRRYPTATFTHRVLRNRWNELRPTHHSGAAGGPVYRELQDEDA